MIRGERESRPRPPANTGRLALFPDLTLDVRRAFWLPEFRTLAVPDVHLGFAWAQRRRGALLPVDTPDDTLERLAALQRDYQPARIVFLGDLVHAVADEPVLRAELSALVARLSPGSELRVVLGNHDLRLPRRLVEWGIALPAEPLLDCGRFRLVHGHEPLPEELLAPPDRVVLLGHEHPGVVLGDGVATSAKCPAFLAGRGLVVAPAFSNWAAGCNVVRREFLGPVARAARFDAVVACVGSRLLRVPLAALKDAASA